MSNGTYLIYKTKFDVKVYHNFYAILIGALSSLIILYFSTGLKILNPSYDNWLTIGDGRSEISWEYYRRTPFPDWLFGDLFLYGMESSKPLFYSTTSPLYALALRPFSHLLTDRFQFLGLMLLVNLVLVYFISFKIFSYLNLNNLLSHFGAFLILLSPVTLHRFIDQTHYVLTANWLILLAIYLVFKQSLNFITWSILISASFLVHVYYAPMIISIYLTWILISFITKQSVFFKFIKTILLASAISSFGLFVSGFFKDTASASLGVIGYYKSNLVSPFNASGWSRSMPELVQASGDYEGFSFPGIGFLLISIISIWFAIKFRISKQESAVSFSFISLWISSVLLFILSLSGNIDFLQFRILTFLYPDFFMDLITPFRATGRFTWVLSYVFMISVFVYVFKNFKNNWVSVPLLILILFIQIYDTYPKISSQKYSRYLIESQFKLESSFWDDVNLCYEAVNSVPAHKFSSHSHELSTKLSVNNVGIYPAFSARDSVEEVQSMIKDMRDDIKFGNYDPDRLYVFQDSEYATTPEEIKLDKRIALGTMSNNSRAAQIDGLLVIAPNFNNCEKLHKNYKNIFTIKNNNLFFISNAALKFGGNEKANNSLVEGWSPPEKWGVWSNSERASLIIKSSESKSVDNLVLKGDFFEPVTEKSFSYKINVNKKEVDHSVKKILNQTYIYIDLLEIPNNEGVLLIDFLFTNLSSPKDNNISDDTRLLGFALKEMQLAYRE